MNIDFDNPKEFILSVLDYVLGAVPFLGVALHFDWFGDVDIDINNTVHTIGTIAVTGYFIYRFYAFVRDDRRKNSNRRQPKQTNFEDHDKFNAT